MEKPLPTHSVTVFCGGERTRTAVQTPHQAAFYTLIFPLIVGIGLPESGRPFTLAFGLSRF